MRPVEIDRMGVRVEHDLEKAIEDVDIIMILRIQLERQENFLIRSLREYSNLYCLTYSKLMKNNRSPVIIHPGPVNRGVEISLEVMESAHSLILDQVTNGVAIRMALMYQLLGEAENDIN